MEASFLQSSAYGELQKALGKVVVERPGWLGIIENKKGFRCLYLPYGPYVVKNTTEFKKLQKEIIAAAREHGCDFVRIEPQGKISAQVLRQNGWRAKKLHIQPPNTVINSVDGKNRDIAAETSQKVRRYARKAAKAGVKYRISYEKSDLSAFLTQLHEVSARTGMKPLPDSYYQAIAMVLFPKKQAGLALAELEGKPIASILFYQTKHTLTYAFAANSTEFRPISPATGLGLFALEYAQESGKKWFDWFGVAPENAKPNDPWQGFTAFKLSFGGERVNYLGLWELPLNLVRYRLYSLLTSLQRALRR
jgi:lipid II:glycine glycyltransferase (peptidoglycan interpeptide bridge formation enzyme)